MNARGKKSTMTRASSLLVAAALACSSMTSTDAFAVQKVHSPSCFVVTTPCHKSPSALSAADTSENDTPNSCAPWTTACHELMQSATQALQSATTLATITAVSVCFLLSPLYSHAEDELAAKYGNGKSFDTSLVDQTCLVNQCSLQAKACLADDPDCRKGLTCTAKCMGDNACITGCMARYGNTKLDNLLKCAIEDNECIKVAILPGGADVYGQEPRSIAPTVPNFNMNSLEGTWFKVVGFNPNYDCYACQRNVFTVPEGADFWSNDKLKVDVEFAMPHLMPDGTPPPPKNEREVISVNKNGLMVGSQSIGFNEYETHEMMAFDKATNIKSTLTNVVFNKGKPNEKSFSRTAHSEGEMFGLKFWENWYVIGENDPGKPEFKFIYYNGKTRQNTYDGAFVYSRTKELDAEAMTKVYKIAADAGMNPDQFCKIRNGCFEDSLQQRDPAVPEPLRGILASTKVSQLLGVNSVAAAEEGKMLKKALAAQAQQQGASAKRPWWYEVGDYLEDPHRHFKAMEGLRQTMDWPDFVKEQN